MSHETIALNERKTGDMAVDGIMAGIAAGVVAALVLVVAGFLSDLTISTVLGRFDPGVNNNPFVGGLLHLGTSAVYGVLFALILKAIGSRWKKAAKYAWIIGLLYGLVLNLIAELALQSGNNLSLAEFTTMQFTMFHIVYGLTLGVILARRF